MARPGVLWAFVVSTCLGSSVAQTVTQPQPEMSVQEAETVTLACTYDTSWSDYYLFWYKQPPSGEMIFIIRQESYKTQNTAENRFSVNFQKAAKHFSLRISDAQLQDAARYFCALKPGEGIWDVDRLFFGKGTYLEVIPRIQPPAQPSVFIMTNGTNVACLVKDFYPKDVNINLQSSKKIVEFDPTIVISPSGKYSAVKLGQYEDSNSVTCSVEHNNKTLHSTDFEPKINSSDYLKPMEPEDIQQTSEVCHEPKVHGGKVNMMSLTVLGLRMLFAKSVAVNFLLTAKLFFF